MSLELVDKCFKYHPQSYAFVEAEARVRGVAEAVVMREIVDNFAAIRRSAFIATSKVLRAKGLLGDLQGFSGDPEAPLQINNLGGA